VFSSHRRDVITPITVKTVCVKLNESELRVIKAKECDQFVAAYSWLALRVFS